MSQPIRIVYFTRKDGSEDSAVVRSRTESGRLLCSLNRKVRSLRRYDPQAAEFLRRTQMYGHGLFNPAKRDPYRPYLLASIASFNQACVLARQGHYHSARITLQDARMFRERSKPS